jgi:hypothetical protein
VFATRNVLHRTCVDHAEFTLGQNCHTIVRMVLYCSAASRISSEHAGSLPYHQSTKRQDAEKAAQHRGKEIAAQGRVQSCPAEAYCGSQLEVWNVLHQGDAVLGQRVTRLQGGLFCDCPSFVERAMHCRHICAVIEHEAASVQAEAKTPRFASTLHRVVQPDAEVRKRSGPWQRARASSSERRAARLKSALSSATRARRAT